jgi:uncharacterized protein YodC (DUF2158 family)
METPQWNQGDIVQLNSGGPHMTVQRQDADGRVHCTWFTNAGEVKRDNFGPAQLTKVEEEIEE